MKVKILVFILTLMGFASQITSPLPTPPAPALHSSVSPVAMAAVPTPAPHRPPVLRPASTYSIFLPVTIKVGSTPPPPPPPASSLEILPYLQSDGSIMTNQTPQVAVDGSGGVHVVYTAGGPDKNGLRPAYYGYCASNCGSPSNFSVIGLGDAMVSAQLALDPAGHPRLLLESQPLVNGQLYQSPIVYLYGECSSQCAAVAN
jgi:hypothetical protein